MKAGWKMLIVAGVVLVVLSGQVMAQPWGGGPGRGQGRFQGPGMGGPGPMAQQWGPQGNRGAGRGQGRFQTPGRGGPGPMAQQWGLQGGRGAGRGQGRFQTPGRGGPGPMAQPWGPQDVRGVRRAPRAGQRGAGAWCPLGMDRGTMGGLLGRRLNLTPDQREKIQDIMEQARSKVQAAIKEVLTEEQLQQLQQMRGSTSQFNRPMQRPGAGMQGGRMGTQGQGMRGPMDARGQGMRGPADVRGQGMGDGTGLRGQGPGGRGMQNWGSQMRPGMQQPPVPSVGGGPVAGGRRQGMGPAQQDGAPPLERLFDRADANDDGALTREELKVFQDTMRGGRQSPQ